MRLWLMLLIGLLCFAVTSCPVDDPETDPTVIEDAEQRKPDFSDDAVDTEEVVEADEAAVCETCDKSPCACEDAPAAVCETCGKEPCECEVEDAEETEDEHAGHDHGVGEHGDG